MSWHLGMCLYLCVGNFFMVKCLQGLMALLVLDFVVEFVCWAGFMVLFEHEFVVALLIVCRDVFAVICLYGLMVFL